jgi:hypothetical protein
MSDYNAMVAIKEWHDPNAFEDLLRQKAVSSKTLVVPNLVDEGPHHSCLRIKVISQQEYRWVKSLATMNPNRFEMVTNDNIFYCFGSEPVDLKHKRAYGSLWSVWGKDPLITKLEVGYGFIYTSAGVVGNGFGGRGSKIPCDGSNSYFKFWGRGTKATSISPLQDKDEIERQQYYRASENINQLMHPAVRRAVNQLSDNTRSFAGKHNPDLMKIVGDICDRQIFTMGNIPKQKQSGDSDLPPPGVRNPSYGFVNASHTDNNDMLTKEQLEEWKHTATQKKWKHCLKLFEQPHFCLPTTCGYQFVFCDDETRQSLNVNAFFAMDGLGLAMQMQHGVAQHFMGAMFSHQTCLTVCQRLLDGKLSISNHENNFIIVGWGNSGGHREVREARDRAATAAAAARVARNRAAAAAAVADDDDDNVPINQLRAHNRVAAVADDDDDDDDDLPINQLRDRHL